MRKYVSLCSLILISMINLVSMPASGMNTDKKNIHIVAPIRTATKSVPGHVSVVIPRIPKFKIFRSNPTRKLQILNGIDPYAAVDDDSIITAYRRRDLQTIKTDITPDNPEGLSEKVRWRLFLARQVALMKYREKYNNSNFT